MLTTGLDYIAYTQNKDRTMHAAFDSQMVECKATNGYTTAHKNAYGAIIQKNDERPDMGVHTILSGQTLSNLTEDGVDVFDILRHAERHAKISRVDVKLDVIDEDFSITELAEEYRDGKCKTLARSALSIDSFGAGDTLYIGSLKSRSKLMRIYDKALQNPLQSVSNRHKRVELEMHSKPAHEMARGILSSGDYARSIMGYISGYASFQNNDNWLRVFADTSDVRIGSYTHDGGNQTVAWLLDVCAPSLARESSLDSGTFVRFMDRYVHELRKLGVVTE